MANKNLLTYAAKISTLGQVFYSPVAVVPPNTNVPLSSLYAFISKVTPWPDDTNPPTPRQDQQYIKNVFKNMIVAKKVHSNQLSPVIKRKDWTSGTVYDYYVDNEDMFAVDSQGNFIKNFYVKNSYDQVFKCLWNNNDSPDGSTIEPYFQPGSYNTNGIFQSTDGYKWKYMYTIDIGSKIKYLDTTWMPVPLGIYSPNPIDPAITAGSGDIEVINVTNMGSGYDTANAVVNVIITGDGTGAKATANVSPSGTITDINIVSTGTNYSYANVTISSAIGSGATAIAPTSPVGGHGYDPVSELGASNIMFAVEFKGNELTNGVKMVPTDITYYQIGVVTNPTTHGLNPNPATADVYKISTDLTVAPGFGTYINDEIVYQGTSLESATFKGIVLSYDPASDVINLINTQGTPTTSAALYGNTSKTARTLLTFNTPDFAIYSGYLSYIENRSGITRSADGIEQFKFVLGY